MHSLDVIRMGEWKLIEADASYYTWSADELQLYNIGKDPYERRNLAATSDAGTVASDWSRLRDRLADWLAWNSGLVAA